MQYVGMHTQVGRNKRYTFLLLLGFPVIILATVWAFLFLTNYLGNGTYDAYGNLIHKVDLPTVNAYFIYVTPYVMAGVLIWFVIAYFFNVQMIRHATGARPLQRSENPRVYNLVENLCMACNMPTPQINVIEDEMLNAFASGINDKTYTVTLTTGIINRLTDDELEGVIAHELTHIRNRDTKLLITSIVFVGIINTIMIMAARTLYYSSFYRMDDNREEKRGNGSGLSYLVILLIGLICVSIAYLFSMIIRFAISRKREYMADAGGAELSGKPWALASALRKISSRPGLSEVKRDDIQQLFIIPSSSLSDGGNLLGNLFSTHPDINKRIEILEQF